MKICFLAISILVIVGCQSKRAGSKGENGVNLSWSTPPVSSALNNQCYGPFKLHLGGNAQNESLNLESSSSLTFYEDSNCLNQLSGTSIAPGQNSYFFYIKDLVSEETDLNISFVDLSLKSHLTVRNVSTLGGSFSMLDIPNGKIGACSGPIKIGLKNQAGSFIASPADILINITTLGSVYFFGDSDCSTVLSDLTFSQNAESVSLYFRTLDLIPFSIQGSSDLGSFITVVNVSPGVASGIGITNTSGNQAECIPVTMKIIDQQGNLTSYNQDVSFSIGLHGTTSSSYPAGDSDCTGGTQSSSFVVPAGASTYTFYVQDDTIESVGVDLIGSNGWQGAGEVRVHCGGVLGFFNSCSRN